MNSLHSPQPAPDKSDPDRRIEFAPSGRIRTAYTATPGLDAKALAAEIAAAITGEVRFDNGSRALYATDSSNYRQVPIGVVIPETKEDVIRTIELCHRHNAPVLPRGGGTSLAGECCNTAVVIDFSKYLNRVLEIDPVRRTARVEPGCILDTLREAAARYGLTFGPDPATHDHNTLGGMIGNNSGGVHALMNGITVFNVRALEVLTYDGVRLEVSATDEQQLNRIIDAGGRRGTIYRDLKNLRDVSAGLIRSRFPDIPRRVSGYENLDQLFPENNFQVARCLVGTEGTCVTVLEATLDLIPNPRERVLVIMGFTDVFEAADAVPRVLPHKPIGLEGMNELLVDHIRVKHLDESNLRDLPEGNGWLIVEFGGDSCSSAREHAENLVRELADQKKVHSRVVVEASQQQRIWKIRDSALGAESYVPNHPDTWPGWEDSAVHPENLGKYLRELSALFHRYGYNPCLYGHFGDGLVHCTVAFDLYDEPGIAKWRRFLDEAAALVVKYNGSLSGEHGDGQARAELLKTMYGPALVEAFRKFKTIWDPQGRMNPGKVVDPYPITSDLRLGPSYHPPKLKTHFAFLNEGNFDRAAQRCVGVGKCRRRDADHEVMCPSYLATHEEKYCTRGRSRLLFEMLHGGPINDRWQSEAVEDALNLCLACKGCKSDCPVHVDMATYKSEFRAHHYSGRLRPRAAYAMGRIHELARAASHVPRLANALMRAPVLGPLTKALGGIAQQRTIPAFAPESFSAWFHRRTNRLRSARKVLLWPDTFNNAFRPETAIAATRVLEAAGFEVAIPDRPLCCGRPLYDWGWLPRAKRLWEETFSALKPAVEAGMPIVGLEPACVSAFRDELVNLFPNDERAKRLSNQTMFFSDFIAAHIGDLVDRRAPLKALVQIHCHQHAVLKTDGERKVLSGMRVEYEVLPSGCCGMAGAFGFEADKYSVSQTIAERVLLPRVRSADAQTVILANGFSCREQIEQGTRRKTFHIAQLIAERANLSGANERFP
ncbi:MAG TPA: FAD-binding and (Fe-S)-binding domain-containing protein [Pseudolabrys sp.]|nr:FAD-binding and (Fe-S)-binding domain-containing protein [Pseudolabrys sp.]